MELSICDKKLETVTVNDVERYGTQRASPSIGCGTILRCNLAAGLSMAKLS